MVGPPYTPVFCIRGSVFTESSNRGSCRTVVVTVEKKNPRVSGPVLFKGYKIFPRDSPGLGLRTITNDDILCVPIMSPTWEWSLTEGAQA